MKRKRAARKKKTVKKAAEVGQNEEAFLDFVNQNNEQPYEEHQNVEEPLQENQNNKEPYLEKQNNLESSQINQNSMTPFPQNQNNLEPWQRKLNNMETNQTNQNNVEPYQKKHNDMEPYQRNPNDMEPYQRNPNDMEPYQRNQNDEEPYHRNMNNMEPYQRNLNNIEFYQRSLHNKDHYSRNLNNDGSYPRNLNNMEPHQKILNNDATYRKSLNNEKTYRKNRNKEGKKMSVGFSDDEYDVSKSESDSLSPLSSSSFSSKSDESYDALGSSSSDDSWVDRKLRKSIIGRLKAKRRLEKLSKKSGQVKGQSSRGLSSLSTKRKKSKTLRHDPRYKKKELKTAYSVIKKVMKMDEAEPFNVPVDPIAQGIPNYFDIVDIPMDFGTICSNLQSGTKYMNSEDVFNDVEYIWNNCCKYSKEGDYILHLMKRVRKKFMKYWTATGLYSKQRRKTSGRPHSLLVGSMNHNFNLMRQDKPASSQRQLPTASCGQQFQAHQPLASTLQPQFSQLPLSYNQPYHLQQPQPSANQPQFSHVQVDIDGTAEGQSHIQSGIEASVPQKRYMRTRHAVSTVNGASQSQLQQPHTNERSFCMQLPQQSTSQPHPCQIQAGTDSAIRCKEGCTMNCGKYVPWCLMDTVHHNPIRTQAQELPVNQESPASAGRTLPQMPQANIGFGDAVTGSAPNGGQSLQRFSVGPATQSHNQQLLDPLESQLEQVAESNHGKYGSKQLIQKKKKGGRGPTRCLFLKDLPEGERILVSFNKIGQPVGPEASKLSSFLGNVARNGHTVPLNYITWRHLPDAIKEDIWQLVQSKFEIEPVGKTWVMKSVATKWRDWKAELKAGHYYPHKTDEERLKDINPRVVPDQWPFLVSYWSSEKEKIRSAKNRANRYKQKAVHAMGTKSFARIREEERAKRSDGKEPSRAELYILTHTRKDGLPVDETAAQAIAKLQEHASQRKTTEGSYSDDRDTFCEVMGEEKHSHVRTYGLGPTPADLRGTTPKRCDLTRLACEVKKLANQELSKIVEKVEAMEQKYLSMEAQIAKINSSMQILLEKVGATSTNLGTKQVPPRLDAAADIHQKRLNSSSSSHAVPSQEAAYVEVED